MQVQVRRLRLVVVLAALVAAGTACRPPTSLVGWGAYGRGQLGPSPAEVPMTRIDAPWASVSAGLYGGAGVRTDGTLWQWGTQYTDNCSAACSPGNFHAEMDTPAQLGAPGAAFSAASQGPDHLLALRRDGTLLCWGANGAGQCGTSGPASYVTAAMPEWYSAESGYQYSWRAASAGNLFSLGIAADGTLWTWGQNDHGQLGHAGSGGNPVKVGTMTWTSVAAGLTHSLGIASDGTLWGWGDNATGELGAAPGTLSQSAVPVQIGADAGWSAVAAGNGYSLALRTDGTLWAWGRNTVGELGDGTTTEHDAPEQIGTATNWVSVSAGAWHALARRADGTAWAWGDDTFGTLGDGAAVSTFLYQATECASTLGSPKATLPQQVGTQTDWTALSAGPCSSTGIRAAGSQREAWGINLFHQFGDGTTTSTGSVTPVGPVHDWTSVAEGADHSVAIRVDGTLWTWGGNEYGQLGDGTTTDRPALVQVGTGTWRATAAGDGFTVAVRSDGTLWAWGRDDDDQLGDGGATNQPAPEQIGSATNWSSVAVGTNHVLALRTDHTLWTWGDNAFGQLGDGTTTNATSPQPVGTAPWQSVSAGDGDSLGVRTDGTLWAWGRNADGRLGDGTTTDRHSPVQVGSGHTWSSVSAGNDFTVALQPDHTLWAWGHNQLGQLGDGTTIDQHLPELASPAKDWTTLAAGATRQSNLALHT